MDEAADSIEVPAICRQITQTRKRLQDEWKQAHPHERGNPFTQEKVAQRVEVSLGAYGSWERGKVEPDNARLRQIATALYLDEDYFLPTGDLATATTRLEAEADRLERMNDSLEEQLAALRALLTRTPPSQSGSAP